MIECLIPTAWYLRYMKLCSMRQIIRRRQQQSMRGNTHKNKRALKLLMLETSQECYFCQLPLTIDTATLDHLIPVRKGKEFARDTKNLVLACHNCNERKAGSMPHMADVAKSVPLAGRVGLLHLKEQLIKEQK